MKATPGMQKIMNIVARHLRTQRQPCVYINGCMYRYDKMKCAAGRLIPDSLYTSNMEHRPFSSVMKGSPALTKYITKNFGKNEGVKTLIAELQRLHDQGDWENFQHIEDGLKQICKEFNLTYPEPKV